jgi:HxlR-like helix-turn-helix
VAWIHRPLEVRYTLTDEGCDIAPALASLNDWGEAFARDHGLNVVIIRFWSDRGDGVHQRQVVKDATSWSFDNPAPAVRNRPLALRETNVIVASPRL